MERDYHFADPFRWQLSAFLRALKEIPQITQMRLQNVPGFVAWFVPGRKAIQKDPLIAILNKERDVMVHRDMLRPRSSAAVGITEGRGMKLGVGWQVDPFTDSDDTMRSAIATDPSGGGPFGILEEDEESMPCVRRSWHVGDFEDDILVMAVQALKLTESLLRSSAERIGLQLPARAWECEPRPDRYEFRVYDRDDLRAGRILGHPM
jgi:hypothetical protein